MSTAPNVGQFGFSSCRMAGLILGMILTLSALTGQAQELTFSFQVTLNGVTSDTRQFGLKEGSLQGLDIYDVPEPPAAPDAAFVTYLAMFDPPASLPNRWRRDFRPASSLMGDYIELWQMDFQSDAIGSEATITIDTVGAVPVPYELYFFGPDVYYEPIEVPDSVTFPVTATNLVFFWELRLADEVENISATWGGVKNLYR